MSIERRIDALVALGSEALSDPASAALIPPAVARELARRWLYEEARDRERATTRAIEEAAESARRRAAEGRKGAKDRLVHEWLVANVVPNARRRPDGSVIVGSIIEIIGRYRYNGMINPYSWPTTEAEVAVLWATVDEREAEWDEHESSLEAEHIIEFNAIIRNGVDAIIEERAADLGIEWTAALLTATVSLPSGERVPWGEATVEQHEARLNMLAGHAATELASASRHRAAIDAIKAAPGAHCLNDLVGNGAA